MTALPPPKIKKIQAPDCDVPKKVTPQNRKENQHTQKKTTSLTLDSVIQKSLDNFCTKVESDQVRKRQLG